MLVDSRGTAVNLGPHLGGGAEGDVYEVSLPGLVAKLLHPPSRTPERQAKLRVMVVRVPKDPTAALGHPTLCWPRELLLERSELVGFLMPRLDVRACLPLHRFMFPQFYPPLFHWGLQLEIAANLAAGLAAIHAEGYVVGDLNFRNVYVTRRCLITFLDCDSMQVTDPATGRVLRCPVGMPEYLAAELQGVALNSVDRTEASDSFAFAVMVCQLLLTGTHPFTGGRGQTREQNILSNDCLLLSGNLPRGAPPPAILPPALLDLLIRCFRDGYRSPRGRPKLHELARALAVSRGQVTSCGAFPTRHVFSRHLVSCPWCDQLRLSIDSYRAAGARAAVARAAAAVAAATSLTAVATVAASSRAAVPAVQATAAAAGPAPAGQALPPTVWVRRSTGAPPLTRPRSRYVAPLVFVVVLLVALAHMVLMLAIHAALTGPAPRTASPSGGAAPTFPSAPRLSSASRPSSSPRVATAPRLAPVPANPPHAPVPSVSPILPTLHSAVSSAIESPPPPGPRPRQHRRWPATRRPEGRGGFPPEAQLPPAPAHSRFQPDASGDGRRLIDGDFFDWASALVRSVTASFWV